jgi:prefoldin subunit 5
MQLYQELKENYDYLKATHDKTSEELNYLKQERFMLINELGGTECGSVEETIDRVKREFENYEKTIEKHQKEIE